MVIKSVDILENKLNLKELELNSLLEVTQAINANLPENSLYKIFQFTLIANLNIKKLALYVFDKEWGCKVSYGTKSDYRILPLSKSLLKLNEITELNGIYKGFEEFDLVLPIAHKTNVLAYVFVGGVQDEKQYQDKGLISFIQTFANIVTVAIENKKLARKEVEQQVFRKELEIAREVQSLLFPKSLPDNGIIKICANYLPHFTIGGDYYDYIPVTDNKFLICIADVSGKGIPAALLMSNFQASLRTLTNQTHDLKKIVKELNLLIKKNAMGERFITFFIALCDTKEKTISYINAGHNPPLLVSSNKEMLKLEKGTTILGIFDTLPLIEEETINFTADSLLFIYTDGLTETSNEKDEEFGIEGLEKFLKKKLEKDVEKMQASLLKKINKFKGEKPYPDDITFLSCYFS